MYRPVHFRFMRQPLASIWGAMSALYRGKSMKILLIAGCLALAASALSGCIVYVAPDHHMHTTPPASDEHPAPVDEKPAPTA